MWRVANMLLGSGLLLGSAGCGQSSESSAVGGAGSAGTPPGCTLGSACGGDPVGTWESTTTQECAPFAPFDPGDSCHSLQFAANDPGQIESVRPPSGDLSLTRATVTYLADGSFSVAFVFEGPGTMSFARDCLSAPGAPTTCEDLAAALAVPLTIENALLPDTLSCAPTQDQGCNCTYQRAMYLGPAGTYVKNGSTLSHTNFDWATDVRFCVTGNTITLADARAGEPLYGIPNVSKVTLTRAPDP